MQSERRDGHHPMKGVASGAAIQAGVLSGEMREIALIDMTPLTLSEIARTNDEQMIYVSATGLIVAAPEIFQQWQQGQMADPARYSMRSVYVFETSAEQYAWLNRIMAVGVYTRTPTGIAGTCIRSSEDRVTPSIRAAWHPGLSPDKSELDRAATIGSATKRSPNKSLGLPPPSPDNCTSIWLGRRRHRGARDRAAERFRPLALLLGSTQWLYTRDLEAARRAGFAPIPS